MSAYRLEDERAIRVGRLVDDWTKSGLLAPEQRDIVMPQLAVDLRRTNKFLRITLFLFGGIILQSALGLVAIVIVDLANQTVAAVLCLLAGGGCLWLASLLVSRYHLYRFGVEEVAGLTAAALVAGGAALLVSRQGDWLLIVGLAAAAGMLTVLYLRFGYVYAAVLAMAAAAALPFLFDPSTALGAGGAEAMQRVAAVIVLTAIATAARFARDGHGDDYPGDALAVIEAAAWLGIYLLVNLVISSGVTRVDKSSTFYWSTYAGMWIVPAAGLWVALRRRERPLLLVSLAMALATLLSNKQYLGSPRYEWDPIVFGLFLMGTAIAVRRWLASGDDGTRFGYTASRLVASDRSRLGSLAMVSAAQADVPVSQSAPPADPTIGGGGRSGGGGAGGSF
jgi:hypothetical protein